MTEKLKLLDQDIICLCRKFAHKCQRVIGITCYGVARVGIYMMAIQAMLGVINYFYQFLWVRTSSLTAVLQIVLLIGCFLSDVLLSRAESAWWHGVALCISPKTTGHWFRLSTVYVSFLGLFFAADLCYRFWQISAVNIIHQTFYPIGAATYYYFGYIDPLPPGRSKFRRWIDSKFRLHKLAPSTSSVS